MADYVFSPDQLPAYKRQLFKQYAFNTWPLAGSAFVYGYFIRQYPIGFSLLVTLGGLATLTAGYLLASPQRAKAVLGYRLTTDAETITRRLPNAMPVTMRFGDVDRVVAGEDENGLILKSSRTQKLLVISPHVAGYEKLVRELQGAIPDFTISAPTLAERALRYRSLIVGGLLLLPFLFIRLTQH